MDEALIGSLLLSAARKSMEPMSLTRNRPAPMGATSAVTSAVDWYQKNPLRSTVTDASAFTTVFKVPGAGRSRRRVLSTFVTGFAKKPAQYTRAYVTVAPAGSTSSALVREVA